MQREGDLTLPDACQQMGQIGELIRHDVDHIALALQEAAAGEHPADSTTRRCRSKTLGQTMRLAWPVSSSIVANRPRLGAAGSLPHQHDAGDGHAPAGLQCPTG